MVPWEKEYTDTGELRPQDEVHIQDFIDDEDRSPMGGSGAPFFSGRVEEINKFRKSVGSFAKGRRSNRTLVFEGPPGCGKSALLTHLSAETNSYPSSDDGERWIAVPITGSSVMSPNEVMNVIDEAIMMRLASDVLEANDSDESMKGRLAEFLRYEDAKRITKSFAKEVLKRGVSVSGFGFGGKAEDRPLSLGEVAIRRSRRWKDWNIVLMIDEAQGITADIAGGNKSLLTEIHQGLTRLPIMFCAFGLYGTSTALGDVGVSRASIEHTFNVSGLDAAHSSLVVDRAFKQFGIRNGEQWKADILERSKNWPQHLSCYLTSVLASVRSDIERHGGLDAHNVSLDNALEKGDVLRKRYYTSRIRSFNKDGEFTGNHLKAVSGLIQASSVKEPIEVDHLTTLVSKECDMEEPRALRLIKASAACGLVAFDDIDDVCYPAIPSFVTHLIGESHSQGFASERTEESTELSR